MNGTYLDALNVTLHWFGGSINRMDIFVASIEGRVMRDLVDSGHLRKRFFGWEITSKGREALEEADIHCFEDTRS
jgi:hypothetical protein